MSRRRKRVLTAEERALWDEVRKSLRKPAAPPAAMVPDLATPIPPVAHPRPVDVQKLARFRTGASRAATTHIDTAPDPAQAPGVSQLDRRTMAKLRTGRERPQARLDLHGMFLDEAHDALNGFIRRSHAERKKMVLVITGKGRQVDHAFHHTPHRRGVLRHALPQWLAAPALAPMILRIVPAQPRDGGAGAWYVWLRRSAK
ncbi:Smr/MutS family protein [Abyssibius alkaniclasticus]|uniref:Smr/MutS family protein n=1 Tax=Abyssibius alkaniclasticus TaxID=2881234 RepID=UPI004059749F